MISKFNEEFRFLLCLIETYSKNAWFIPLKDKKGTATTKAFQKILKESYRKPNKISVDKGSEFHNKSMKSWLEKMLYKYIQRMKKENLLLLKVLSISKNVYIDKLEDIVSKYNNTYHNTIKMKPVDVKSSTYID